MRRKRSEGYHRWTQDELAAFEAKHPLGTKPRLAFALLLYGAQRSGDVRLMTHESIAGGRVRLDQSKIAHVVLLEAKHGEPYTPKGFYNLMKRACIAAGVPHCSPPGLRKSAARRCREAGCSDDQGMAINGHKTVKDYRRYAGEDARGALADAGMALVLANLPGKLATASSQTIGEAAECL